MANYRFVIHVGYPKAASTALQDMLANSRPLLHKHGVHYPEALVPQGSSKHEELFRLIRLNRVDQALKQLQLELRTIKGVRTVFLSTESFVNQLDNFDDERWGEFFQKLALLGNVEILLVRRDSAGFLKSYYKQAVINQPLPLVPFYGTGLCLEAFAEIPEVQRLLDVGGRIDKLKRVSSAPVHVFDYGAGVVGDVISWLTDGKLKLDLSEPANVSLKPEVIEFIRQLNLTMPESEARNAWFSVLRDVANFSALDSRVASTLADRANREEVLRLNPLWLSGLQVGRNPAIGVDDAKLIDLLHNAKLFLQKLRP